MNSRSQQIRYHITSVVLVVATLPFVWAAMSFGTPGLLGAIALVGLIVAVYIGLQHPLWFYWGMAAVLGIIAVGRIPGIPVVPTYLPFELALVVAALVHPRMDRTLLPMHPMEWAMLLFWGLSTVSFLVTTYTRGFPLIDIISYFRLTLGLFALLALLQLSPKHLATFGRIFVWLCSANGLWGLFLLLFDPDGRSLRVLRPFGYTSEVVAQYQFQVVSAGGFTRRLGGTWMEPNSAGGNLAMAALLCILLFTGWKRIALTTLLLVTCALTLSRSAIFGLALAVVLVLIFHPMQARTRATLSSVVAVAAIAAALTPAVRNRVLQTFNTGDDISGQARLDALRAFPGKMSGYWPFGHGWGLPEFTDPAVAYALNLPSNAPLIVLYMRGILPFLAFLIIEVIAVVVAYRAIRSHSFSWAMYGAGIIGIGIFASLLDHGYADTPQGVLTLSIQFAFLVYVDRARVSQLRKDTLLPEALPDTAPKLASAAT